MVSPGADEWPAPPEVGEVPHEQGEISVAMAWFPAGEYEKAIARWDGLAEDLAGVAHADYCRRMDGHIKWMRAHGVYSRAARRSSSTSSSRGARSAVRTLSTSKPRTRPSVTGWAEGLAGLLDATSRAGAILVVSTRSAAVWSRPRRCTPDPRSSKGLDGAEARPATARVLGHDQPGTLRRTFARRADGAHERARATDAGKFRSAGMTSRA